MIVTYVFVFLFLLMGGLYDMAGTLPREKNSRQNVNNTKQDSTSRM